MIPLWNELAAGAGIELSDTQLKQLDLYLELLIEKNQELNLTRITDRADAEIRHVADALTLLPLLPPVRLVPPTGRDASSPSPRAGGVADSRDGVRGQRGELIPVAKKLRRDATVPEKYLWSRLRAEEFPFKFRRQHPIGRYIVDYYCSQARLVVEVDGISHEQTAEGDAVRQAWLESQGIRVIRFGNDEVLKDATLVAEHIERQCREEPLTPPSPASGEGEETQPPGKEAGNSQSPEGSRFARHPLSGPRSQRQLTLADVGTGGGIPGVILAIARPDIAVTLIDATAKKLNAVDRMCDTIGLENIKSIHGRMETLKLQFDIIAVRGVAELGKLLTWCRPLMKPSGVLLAMKGPKVVEEIANFSPQLRRRFRLVHHPAKPAELAGHVNIEVRLGREKA